MFDFAWPLMVLMLPLPWLVWRFVPPATQMMQGVLFAPFVDGYQREKATGAIMGTRKKFSLLFWGAVVCWILLILTIARPQWLGEAIELPETGRNLLLAVDVSGSMEIVDMNDGRSNRLDVVKKVAGDFIKRREGDRIGLILFGT
ncbi:MAG: VWA domain-containing protein, partial [Nitrosomonas sp.]|nr:VWA domain-containing protein [Nitrosomonas sp.]